MTFGESLSGRIALVTGGSNGIGASTVRRLAAEGATLVVGYNQGAERARQLIADLPGSAHSAVRIVLEDSSSIRQAAAEIEAKFGRLDILVNSAGYTQPVAHSDLEGLSDELFDSVLVSNVRGVFSTIRSMVPLLRKSQNGVIVNVSSISAFVGLGSSIAYSASKAGLDTMTISLARVLGPSIRIMSVSPGPVATDFVAGRGRAALEQIAKDTPLRRVVEPEDVAEAIFACVSHLRVSTGVKIVVDGGSHLR